MSEEELVHVVTECAKLAFADRDALYGDAQPVPLDTLLSARLQRRAPRARHRRRRRRSCAPAWAASPSHHTPGDTVPLGVGEPTRGDTVHLDVADRFGNLFSATPSGGWLQSSPVDPVARLAARHARADVLARGGPAVVARAAHATAHDALARPRAPRRRAVARVRHSRRRPAGAVGAARPAPARRSGAEPAGGDRRARLPHRAPDRLVLSARLQAEPAARGGALRRGGRAGSRARGHDVVVTPPWSLGRVTAVKREDGQLVAAANPRGMQGYAVAR